MKHTLFIIAFCSEVFALQAPYLISAVAQSDSTILLTWRNNDAATQRFFILRKNPTEASFAIIDSTLVSTASYLDTHLRDSTSYAYAIYAFGNGVSSDTSNKLTSTTLSLKLTPPSISLTWNFFEGDTVANVMIGDSSKSEDGILLFRSGGQDINRLIYSLVSQNPKTIGQFSWKDITIKTNTRYIYKAAAYKGMDTVFSNLDTLFTFRASKQDSLVTFQKISEYPINWGGFASFVGDSLILKEGNAPSGSYSIINLTDISKPGFKGYTDSSTLANYPIKTLLPIYVKYGIFSSDLSHYVYLWNNFIFVAKDSLILYQIQSGKLIPIDTLDISTGTQRTIIPAIDDSIIILSQVVFKMPISSWLNVNCVRYSGLSLRPQNSFQLGFPTLITGQYTDANCIGGYNGNMLYVSEKTYTNQGATVTVFNHFKVINCVDSSFHVTLDGYGIDGANTGQFLARNIILIMNGDSLFGVDPRDPRCFQYYGLNNIMFQDTGFSNRGRLMDVITDTVLKRVYLFYQNSLSIIGYDFVTGFNTSAQIKPLALTQKQRSPNIKCSFQNGFIWITGLNARATASLFNAAGRMIDKIEIASTLQVYWKPKITANRVYFLRIEYGNTVQFFKLIESK